MALHLDHVVVLVDDLEQAARDYGELGFNVSPGGRHDNGVTHNAIIPFEDNSYIELLAFTRGLGAMGQLRPGEATFLHRVKVRGAAGEGLVDYALRSDVLMQDVRLARGRGIPFEPVATGSRRRPDGLDMRWQFVMPSTLMLPFLITDITEHRVRVPEGEARRHPNGVTGLLRLVFAVRDLEDAVAAHTALLGRAPLTDAGVPHMVDFLVGGTTLRLLGEQPATDRPLAITLQTADPSTAGRLDLARAHGAVIELEAV